jgi:hypothetical protein
MLVKYWSFYSKVNLTIKLLNNNNVQNYQIKN